MTGEAKTALLLGYRLNSGSRRIQKKAGGNINKRRKNMRMGTDRFFSHTLRLLKPVAVYIGKIAF